MTSTAGTNLAYVIKKGEAVNGNYEVAPIELLAIPTHILDVNWVDDGIIIRYKTEKSGDVNEGIMFRDVMALG